MRPSLNGADGLLDGMSRCAKHADVDDCSFFNGGAKVTSQANLFSDLAVHHIGFEPGRWRDEGRRRVGRRRSARTALGWTALVFRARTVHFRPVARDLMMHSTDVDARRTARRLSASRAATGVSGGFPNARVHAEADLLNFLAPFVVTRGRKLEPARSAFSAYERTPGSILPLPSCCGRRKRPRGGSFMMNCRWNQL